MRGFATFLLGIATICAHGQVWSPNGSKIAFFYIHDIEDIYTVAPDGSNFTILEGHPDRDFAPMWSPDGKHIVFTSVRDGHHEIYQFDTDGEQLRKLTDTSFDSQDGALSPDGKEMVFTSNRDGNHDVYIKDLESAQVRRLTNTPSFEYTARWSPKGDQILFLKKESDDSPTYLHVMRPDGTGVRQLSDVPGFHPSFSFDGEQICFVHVSDKAFEVHLISAQGGSSIAVMSKDGYQAFYPCFSPDGQTITFTRDMMEGTAEGLPALYAIGMDGSERLITSKNSFPQQ